MSKSGIIFITGTDTGVGKTLLTALLLHHLRERGVRALAMKPFCSGGRADVRLLQSVQPGELTDAEVNPFYFEQPVAPLVAQKQSRRPVRLREVISKIKTVARKCDCLLIEGSGGLLVPLGPGFMVSDLISALECRVIVVARNRLGTINHTLLTVGALRGMGVKPRGMNVVLMGQKTPDLSAKTNFSALEELVSPVSVGEIPFLGGEISGRAGVIRGYARAKKALKRLESGFGTA